MQTPVGRWEMSWAGTSDEEADSLKNESTK